MLTMGASYGAPNFNLRGLIMNENIEKLFNENGVDKVAFYYKSTPLVDNAYTTCILVNTEKGRIESRGIAICSMRDTFNKNKGKNKAFGRAIEAVVRKINSGKINPCGRDCEGVRRQFKIKTEQDQTKFESAITELNTLHPELEVVIINDGSKNHTKYCLNIPASYPIRVANKDFKYKSQFRPNPAGSEESKLLDKGI